jgi:hypothetical protein
MTYRLSQAGRDIGIRGPIYNFADAVASGDLESALNGPSAPARALAIAEAHAAYTGGFAAALAAAAVEAALAALVVHLLMRGRG